MNENTANQAMQIILHAGDARAKCQMALKHLSQFELEEAKAMLKQANDEIIKAHIVQTDAIQDETRGKSSQYSLLFAHAQDTLMTIYSELNIAKQLLKLTASIDARFKKLEGRNLYE